MCVAVGFAREPYRPQINPANFRVGVNHPYFQLKPGTVSRYVEKGGGETSESEVTVTHDTKTIMGVKCTVVREIVTRKGQLIEDTCDWYAQDKAGTVWHFGQATEEFKAGGAVDIKGSWEAGINGQPGISMPADPKPGPPYLEDYSPNNAEDMAQIVAINETVSVPAGTFTGCVKIRDWSLLESGTEYKWYAKDIGIVQTRSTGGQMEALISIKRVSSN